MKKIPLIIAAVLALSLAACGKQEVSFDTLETQRSVANDNSKFNAQKWRAENGFETLNILARGDSTQQADCPQGDGWASIDLIDPKAKTIQVQLKCSTVSGNLGCYLANDFKARAVLASQENRCNHDIPKTLKKIEN